MRRFRLNYALEINLEQVVSISDLNPKDKDKDGDEGDHRYLIRMSDGSTHHIDQDRYERLLEKG